MKKLTYLPLFLLSILFLGAIPLNTNVGEPVGINFFSGTYAQALEKAKKENKLIFFDAYAVWCRPCLQMKKHTFTDPTVAKFFNENFINVMMDMEKGEGVALAEKMDIGFYPTLLFIDGNGNIKAKKVGYLDAPALLEFGKTTKGGK